MHNFAIVGAGPSGIYAADALANKFPTSKIIIFDSIPSPYGLVRSGVAPDHEKIKEVSRIFDKVFCKDNIQFVGGVKIGLDISIEVLKPYFSAIILCHGASLDRKLGIANENLKSVVPATSFVGWYNVNPEYSNFVFPEPKDKNNSSAVIIGQGNVAIDISRILLKSSIKELYNGLSETDISRTALSELGKYSFRKVHLVGRRGPLQAACTDKELKELCKLEGVSVVISADELRLSEEEKLWLSKAPKGIQKNYEILTEFSQNKSNADFELHIRFCLSPHSFIGKPELHSVVFSRTNLSGPPERRSAIITNEQEEIIADYAFVSVGYKGKSIPGVNFSDSTNTYPNVAGRIENESGLYTSGWIKRGPSGVIGTNKSDSVETVSTLVSDIESGLIEEPAKDLKEILEIINTNVFTSSYPDWKKLDAEELRLGASFNKSRVKFETLEKMQNFLREN